LLKAAQGNYVALRKQLEPESKQKLYILLNFRHTGKEKPRAGLILLRTFEGWLTGHVVRMPRSITEMHSRDIQKLNITSQLKILCMLQASTKQPPCIFTVTLCM